MKLLRQYTLPIVILLIITTIGWVGLDYMANQNQEKLAIKTDIMAEQLGIRLQEFIQTRLARLEIFRESMQNKMQTEAEFRSKALLIQHELSGFQAINWVDPEGIIQWVTPLSKNLPAFGVNILEKGDKQAAAGFERSRLYRIDMATTSINLIQGGVGFATYLPVIQQDKIVGFVNGVFRIEELINQCFGNTIHEFNYEVNLAGKRVYMRGESSNFESPTALGRYNFIIYGQAWELQVVPGSSSSQEVLVLDVVSMAGIILIALLISAITLFRQRSRIQLAAAYKRIEDSEIKFRTIFDKSPACLLRFNQEAVITDWNRDAASLFEFEFPPKTRKSVQDLQCMVPLLPAIEQALSGENAEYYGFIDINGRNTAIDARIETLLSGSDQIQGGIVLLNDVTEQNQILHAKEVMYEIANLANREKELPQLFREIHSSLGRVLDAQNFYVALYDETKDEFSYPYYQDEFDSPPPNPIKAEKGLSAYILKRQETLLLTKNEVYDLHKKGAIELIGTPSEQWLGSCLKVEGKPIGVMAVQSYSTKHVYQKTDMEMMNFVSEQIAVAIKIHLEDSRLRESEIMHRNLSEQLSESNNMKALLLDIITHDLKNPVSVISGMTELLVEEGEKSEEIKLIQDSSDALLKIIENTTAMAQLTLGEEIDLKQINISALLDTVVKEFDRNFREKSMDLKLEIEEDLFAEANLLIAEIFRNYLSNALKYGPQGKAVTCGLRRNDGTLRFFVQDQGDPILGPDRENIFNRRIQLEKKPKQGSGLGLAIVKRIAEAHNASFGVEPAEDTGNIFYLDLPVKQNSNQST